MFTEKDIEEIGKKYNIEFRYTTVDGRPGSKIKMAYADYTHWKDIKKYYKRRPGNKRLIVIYLDGEREWFTWEGYKECKDSCKGKNSWGQGNNQKGYGYIVFPRTLENISIWRVEDFLDGNSMNPFKLGTYQMYLNNKEEAEQYLNLCLKNHQAMIDLQENETFKGCLNTYKDNIKKIEEATNSNNEIVKKLQTIIQRKAKIETDTNEV